MFVSTKQIATILLDQYTYYDVMDESGEHIKKVMKKAVHYYMEGNYAKCVITMMEARNLILNDLSFRKHEFDDLTEEEELMLKERC